MATTNGLVRAPVGAVWEVLADGWSYHEWVVGTTGIRRVDDGWPAVGSTLQYVLGRGQLSRSDRTVVRFADPQHRLELQAHAPPFGTARVAIELVDWGAETVVIVDEHPLTGWGARLHTLAGDVLLRARNRRMLANLSAVVERRQAGERSRQPA